MKKTKLLTSLAALALVLSLGACTEPTEDETTSEETSDVETTDTTTSEEAPDVAYAIVGDFADSTWKESPATDSIYYIPAGTTHYEVTVTIDDAPTENESWTEENQWDAGLSVVEYGTWNRVIAFSELDKKSTGVGETAGTDNNIVVNWGSTYHLFIDFGRTNSIRLREDEENTITEMLATVAEGNNYYAENTYIFYQSDVVSNTPKGLVNATVSPVQWFECDVYATQDALYLDYYDIEYAYGRSGYGYYAYYMDAELYVNDDENNQTLVYYVDQSQGYYGQNYITGAWYLALADTQEGTWQDSIWSLMDLADYSWAFSVAETESTGTYAYGDVEDYDVDETALDALLMSTIGNNYIWDNFFAEGMGWNYYFGYADAADIYSFTEYVSGGYYTSFEPILEIGFDDGGALYYYGKDEDGNYLTDDKGNYLVLYQEVEAYTDIYLDKVGKTEIPQDSFTIVEDEEEESEED